MSLEHYIEKIKIRRVHTGSYHTSNPPTIYSKNGKYGLSLHYSEDVLCGYSIRIFFKNDRQKRVKIIIGGDLICQGIDENILVDMIESFEDELSRDSI